MIILGSNILQDALQLIDRQFVTYYKFISRVTNAVGEWVSTYDLPITVEGSFQPVPRVVYDQYGLDYSKEYFTFFALFDIKDLDRNVSGDKIVFGVQEYHCETNTEWYAIDEWVEVLCVKINDA